MPRSRNLGKTGRADLREKLKEALRELNFCVIPLIAKKKWNENQIASSSLTLLPSITGDRAITTRYFNRAPRARHKPLVNPSPRIIIYCTGQWQSDYNELSFQQSNLNSKVFSTNKLTNCPWCTRVFIMAGRSIGRLVDSSSSTSNHTFRHRTFPNHSSAPATMEDKRSWKGFCEIESEPVRFESAVRNGV